MSDKMKLKAYQLLSEIKDKMLRKIMQEARNRTEYDKDKPEESALWMEYISNPDKWEYCGLLSDQDKKVMETLEYLLNDEMVVIRKYVGWKPMER